MKPKSMVTFILGAFLMLMVLWVLVAYKSFGGIVPLLIGWSLVNLSWSQSRIATLVFGHTIIVVGLFQVTQGIYLLSYSKPTLVQELWLSFLWSLISFLGGLWDNYPGFCVCVRKYFTFM